MVIEDTIFELNRDRDNENIHIPYIRKECNLGHWHKMSSCIFCGRENILYIEQDIISKKTGRFIHLDIRTNEPHSC
jgi:hypothetical protein